MILSVSPKCSTTVLNSRTNEVAAAAVSTLALTPTGTSTSTCVDPAAIFFDGTDDTSEASPSKSRFRETRLMMLSAGLNWAAPLHTMQPPSRSTKRRMCAMASATGAGVSMASAVPAGEVLAREEAFGTRRSQAATIGTTGSVMAWRPSQVVF